MIIELNINKLLVYKCLGLWILWNELPFVGQWLYKRTQFLEVSCAQAGFSEPRIEPTTDVTESINYLPEPESNSGSWA